MAYTYKGQEFNNVQELQKKTRLKQSVLSQAYINGALSKVVVDKKTGFVDYIDYRKDTAPQLERDELKSFNKNVKKEVIFSNRWNTLRKGRGRTATTFTIGNSKNGLDRFKNFDVKLLINSIQYKVGAQFSDAFVIRKHTLYFNPNNPARMNIDGIIEYVVNYIQSPQEPNHWDFLSQAGVNRQTANVFLVDEEQEDEPQIELTEHDEDQRNIYLYITGIREAHRPEDDGTRRAVIEGGRYYIREFKPLDIKNYSFYNCSVFEYENPENKNCLVNYIENHFKNKKRHAKTFKYDGDEPTFKEFTSWLSTNEYQTAYLFDINGKVLYSQLGKKAPATSRALKFNNIYSIIHNNHIYPLKSAENNAVIKKLIKHDKNADKMVVIKDHYDYMNKMIEIIEQGYEPEIINDGAFIHDGIEYISNEDADKIKKLYEHFGLKPNYRVNQFNGFLDFFELYNIDYSSYFSYDYKQTGFNYFNKHCKLDKKHKIVDGKHGKVLKSDDVISIDMNKSYPSCLASLDFIITCNMAYNKAYKYNNEPIVDHYLYIIETTQSCIYTPDYNMIVSGQYVNFIKDKSRYPFKIVEFIETTKHENKFKPLLEKAFSTKDKELMDFIKFIFNIMIGKMQKTGKELKKTKKNFKLVSKEALEFEASHTTYLNDDYAISYEMEEKDIQLYMNNLPISYQILEKSRMRLIDMLVGKLNANIEDVIQIKTDCIVVKNKNKYINKFKNDPNDFYGWKIETKNINLLSASGAPQRQNLTFFRDQCIDPLTNQNTCLNENAGGGKTYRIINEVIKKMDNDYVVMAYQHTTLQEYRKLGINNNTIDHYLVCNAIPSQKNIIVDEFGLLREQHLLFILSLYYRYGKIIHFYGDNSQLPPAFNDLGSINDNFLKMFFKNYNQTAWKNYRNKFTNEDYDKMRNVKDEKDLDYIVELLDKYTTDDIKKADHFIAYRRENVEALKKKVLKSKGLIFDKDNNIVSNGLKVVNTSNHTKYKNVELFNKQIFWVVSSTDEKIVLKDDCDNEITIDKPIFWKHFEIGYVETLYSCQGKTLKNFYFDRKDISFLYKIPNALYTLISRYSN